MQTRPTKGRLVFLLVCALALSGCGHARDRESKNVLFIIVDTLRADHLGCYGYERALTPSIDELASSGVRFENVVTAAPVTAPSIATLMTSTLPSYHGVRDNEIFSLNENLPTLASAFSEAGYLTAGFVSSVVLNRRGGFAAGFAHYDDDLAQEYVCYDDDYAPQRDELQGTQRRAEAVTGAALDWLRGVARGKPFLCFVHYFDPHDPYDPPPPAVAGLDKYPYDGEIAYTDAQIGRLLGGLEELGLRDKTLVVLTADHGEGLGEHLERTHGFFLYDATVMVPLVFCLPGIIPSEVVLSSQVRTLDVMPTILDLAGAAVPETAQGVSLARAILSGLEPPDMDAYIETYHTLYSYNWHELTGMRTPDWKYVRAPVSELYDLRSDPGEMDNLAAFKPEIVSQMEDLLRRTEEEHGRVSIDQSASRTEYDSAVVEKMMALGYLGGSRRRAADLPEPGGDLPDPKEQMPRLNARQEAGGHLRRAAALTLKGDYERALQSVAEAERVAPDYAEVWATRGLILARKGDTDEGIALMERAIESDPRAQMAHQTLNNLGLAYLQKGDCARAIESLEKSQSVRSDYYNALYNLGLAHETCGNTVEAIRAYERFLNAGPAIDNEQLRALTARLERLKRSRISSRQ